MRHAHRFQSAVYCLASCLAAPIGADLVPSHLDPVEDAGTAASFDQSAADSGSCRPALAASSTELRWLAELSHARPIRNFPLVLEHGRQQSLVRFAPLQSPTLSKTRVRTGGWWVLMWSGSRDKGKPLKLRHYDISRAHFFQGKAQRLRQKYGEDSWQIDQEHVRNLPSGQKQLQKCVVQIFIVFPIN